MFNILLVIHAGSVGHTGAYAEALKRWVDPRSALIVIHKSASTLIVPIALRGHASRDAPRHKWHRLRIQ
ncbi:hypothetical protein RT94_06530 [Pseudomonas viridiflava]|nr:hypothetical protein RT94_06530 [Pseudomonas viridiflava]